MTKTLLLIVCAALGNCLALRAQLSQACLHVDLGGNDYLCGMALDGAGGYVLAGFYYSDGTHPSAEIARVSAAGTLTQGLHSIHADQEEVLQAVTHTPDGGFAVGGYTGISGIFSLLVAKFNSDGELLWNRSVGEQGPSAGQALAISAADNGNILVAGSRADASANYRPYVLKFDSEGNLIWKWLYEFAETVNGNATGIAALPDGGCIVNGYQYDDPFTVAHALIMRLDNAGQVVWSRTTPPGARLDGVAASDDGGYVFSGSVEYPVVVGGYHDLCMVKIDANGQLIWDVIVGTDDTEFGTAIARTTDDGFVAGGTCYDSTAHQAYLAKVNGAGQLLWTRKIGGATSQYECFAVKPTVNGLALGIRASDGSQTDMGLVLTNELGMPCPACGVDSGGSASEGITFEDHAVTLLPIADTIPRDLLFAEAGTSSIICDGVGLAEITSALGAVTIAPQPMGASARVTLPNEWLRSDRLTFALQDALGRQVMSMAVSASSFELDRRDVRAGAYHYQLRSRSRTFAAGTLVME